jgi:hypothetical protein
VALQRRNIKHDGRSKCSTEGCPDLAVILDKCAACYQWAWYWNRQPPSKRLRYTRRVARTQARVQELVALPRLRLVPRLHKAR